MNIFLAPLFSLYSLRFYRQVVQSSLSKGFGYLAYLSAVASLAFAVLFLIYGKPELKELTTWLETSLPQLVYSPKGLTMNAQGPQTIVHPKYGLAVTFDMTKENISLEEMGNALIFVTSKTLYVRQRGNQMRVYSLAKPGQPGREVSVNEVFKKTFKIFNRLIVLVIFVAAFPIFFVWKLLAALFYSLVGLLINLMRKTKLSYSAVFSVSLFALTPICFVQFLKLSFPALPLTFGFWGALFLATIYLFLGIKLTEEKSVSS